MGSRFGPIDPFYQELDRRARADSAGLRLCSHPLVYREAEAVENVQAQIDQGILTELGEAEARSRRAFAALPWWVQRKHQALDLVYTRVLVPSYDTMCAGLDLVEAKGLSALRCKARDLLNWASARIYR